MSPLFKSSAATIAFTLACNVFSAPVSPEPAVPSAPALESQPTCYNFKEKDWRFYSNRHKPRLPVIGDKAEMMLIPDNLFHTGVAAAISSPIKPPFEVTFDYSTWDDDGSQWAIWNSADGFTFFFLKDTSDYGTPTDGSSLGLNPEGDGYAVWFKLYGSRSMGLTGANNMMLDWDRFDKAYSRRSWIPVSVTVGTDNIIVKANNKPILHHQATIDESYSDLGFSAATGAADAEIAVRNLCIKALPDTITDATPLEPRNYPPVHSDSFVPAPGLEGLDTFPVNSDQN